MLAFFHLCHYHCLMAQSAYDKALYLLTSREHTERELRTKLSQKGYREEDVDGAMERVKREGYLSEERFVEVFLRSRMRKSPEGKRILMMRLLEKGSPKSIASEILDQFWESEEWKKSLKDELESITRRKGKDYAVSKMMQKGFTMREIKEAMEDEDE